MQNLIIKSIELVRYSYKWINNVFSSCVMIWKYSFELRNVLVRSSWRQLKTRQTRDRRVKGCSYNRPWRPSAILKTLKYGIQMNLPAQYGALLFTSEHPEIWNENTMVYFNIYQVKTPATTLCSIKCYLKTPWSESGRELYRPSDCRLWGKLVPTFVDRLCHVVSVTDSYGRILGFLNRILYFFLASSSSVVLTRLSGPRSRPTTQKIW
jgi:hypothetical protein